MFDELDIMLKETSNDIYKYQCMFECSLIEIGMEDDIYTEAEGNEKDDSIFKRIGEKLKELLDKVVERTNKAFGSLAQKLAEVAGKGSPEDKVADIQKAAGKDANFAKEVNDWLSDKSEYYTPTKQKTKVFASKLQIFPSLFTRIESAITGDKLFKSQAKSEIAKLSASAAKLENPTDTLITAGTVGLSIANIVAMTKLFAAASDIGALRTKYKERHPDTNEEVVKVGTLIISDTLMIASGIKIGRRIANLISMSKAHNQAAEQKKIAVENCNQAASAVASATAKLQTCGNKINSAEMEAARKDMATVNAFIAKFHSKADLINRGKGDSGMESRKKFADEQLETSKDKK